MKSKTALIAVIGNVFAFPTRIGTRKSNSNTDKPATETTAAQNTDTKGRHGPVDLDKFSAMGRSGAADTDGDGVLSRAEIEALAQSALEPSGLTAWSVVSISTATARSRLRKLRTSARRNSRCTRSNEDGKIDRSEMRVRSEMHHARGSHHKGPHRMEHHKAESTKAR